jgi:3-oxoacyl-[acyl-carrier-protein] synthase-3
MSADELDLIVVGSTLGDEICPNVSSGTQKRLGARNAAVMDVNTACTSFLYGLSSATALIRTGVVRTALVVGAEAPSPFMDWDNRNVAVLFGDGCAAVVLEASDREEGLLADKLGCYADARQILRVRGHGTTYANRNLRFGDTQWDFDGQEIFKRAVHGMGEASADVLERVGTTAGAVDLMVPHQANLRIIEFVAKRAGIPMDKVFLTIGKYGNMSAATVPVALVEAVEAGAVKPHALILTPAFGAGLTWCSHLIRWGERVTPVATSAAELPPCHESALAMVNGLRKVKQARTVSAPALAGPIFPESELLVTEPAERAVG